MILEQLPASVYEIGTTSVPPQCSAVDQTETRPKRLVWAPDWLPACRVADDDDEILAKAIKEQRLK